MVGKAAYEMRALDYGAVVVEGVDVGGIGCCCSSTISNEGEHVCIGNKSRDTAVACTRRQQQQNSSSGRSGTAAAAAEGQQQQQQQRGVVDGASVVGSSAGSLCGSSNTRGEGIASALVMVGLRSTVTLRGLFLFTTRVENRKLIRSTYEYV